MSERKLHLSEQQEAIATLAASGLINKEIARKLRVGARAVETQFRRMREKLNTSNKTETIAVIHNFLLKREDQVVDSLAGLTQTMPALLVAFDKRYSVVATNIETDRLLSIEKANIEVGRNLWKQITPGVAHRQRLPVLSAESMHDYCGHVVEMTTVSGQRRWISWSSRAHSNPITGWHSWAVGWDVTEQHCNSTLLNLLEMASTTSRQGIWILDEHMNTLFANKAMETLLETTDAGLRESNPLDYVPEEMQKNAYAFLKAGGGTIDMNLNTAAGRTIFVRKRVTWGPPVDGRPQGILVTVDRID